jgi:hypothetical protein
MAKRRLLFFAAATLYLGSLALILFGAYHWVRPNLQIPLVMLLVSALMWGSYVLQRQRSRP